MKHNACNGCLDQFGLCFALFLLMLFSRTGALLWPDESGVRRSSVKRENVDPQLTMRDQPVPPHRQTSVPGQRARSHPYQYPQFYHHYSHEQDPVSCPVGFSYPRPRCLCNCNNNIVDGVVSGKNKGRSCSTNCRTLYILFALALVSFYLLSIVFNHLVHLSYTICFGPD